MSSVSPPEPDTRPDTARRLIPLLIAMSAVGPLSLNILVPVVLAGLALTALASIGAAFAANIGTLIVARLIQSLGGSTGLVIGRAIIRDLVDRNRAASMLGLVTTVMVVVPMTGPLIGGVLDTAFGWQGIFLFIAALSLAVLAWAALTLPETRTAAKPAGGAGFLSHLRALSTSRVFAGYVLSAGLGTATFFVFLGGSPYVIVTLNTGFGSRSHRSASWPAISPPRGGRCGTASIR